MRLFSSATSPSYMIVAAAAGKQVMYRDSIYTQNEIYWSQSPHCRRPTPTCFNCCWWLKLQGPDHKGKSFSDSSEKYLSVEGAVSLVRWKWLASRNTKKNLGRVPSSPLPLVYGGKLRRRPRVKPAMFFMMEFAKQWQRWKENLHTERLRRRGLMS